MIDNLLIKEYPIIFYQRGFNERQTRLCIGNCERQMRDSERVMIIFHYFLNKKPTFESKIQHRWMNLTCNYDHLKAYQLRLNNQNVVGDAATKMELGERKECLQARANLLSYGPFQFHRDNRHSKQIFSSKKKIIKKNRWKP